MRRAPREGGVVGSLPLAKPRLAIVSSFVGVRERVVGRINDEARPRFQGKEGCAAANFFVPRAGWLDLLQIRGNSGRLVKVHVPVRCESQWSSIFPDLPLASPAAFDLPIRGFAKGGNADAGRLRPDHCGALWSHWLWI
jgi:hypothetical protein